MIEKNLPYSVIGVLCFDENTFYEMKVEGLKSLREGVFGQISFCLKDFNEGINPVVIKRHDPESYFGFGHFDNLIDENGMLTDYKRLVSYRIEISTGISLSKAELNELFCPLEKELLR